MFLSKLVSAGRQRQPCYGLPQEPLQSFELSRPTCPWCAYTYPNNPPAGDTRERQQHQQPPTLCHFLWKSFKTNKKRIIGRVPLTFRIKTNKEKKTSTVDLCCGTQPRLYALPAARPTEPRSDLPAACQATSRQPEKEALHEPVEDNLGVGHRHGASARRQHLSAKTGSRKVLPRSRPYLCCIGQGERGISPSAGQLPTTTT